MPTTAIPFSMLSERWSKKICTLDTCPIKSSSFGYYPSVPCNVFFVVLFFISFNANAFQGFLYRRHTLSFAILMLVNNALEVIGYVGRANGHHDPFAKRPYLMQIICLTIAPLFMCAGIYLCLGRVVTVCGERISYLKPRTYARIFIPCDFGSLLLQAAGGAIASSAADQNKDPSTGNKIILAGVVVQVCTLFFFIAMYMNILRHVWIASKQDEGRDISVEPLLDPTYAELRARRRFRGFLVALMVATVCVFVRSVYRVVEMAGGWNGRIIKTQSYFIALEGCMISLGVIALNLFHPGYCLWRERGKDMAGVERRGEVEVIPEGESLPEQDRGIEKS